MFRVGCDVLGGELVFEVPSNRSADSGSASMVTSCSMGSRRHRAAEMFRMLVPLGTSQTNWHLYDMHAHVALLSREQSLALGHALS